MQQGFDAALAGVGHRRGVGAIERDLFVLGAEPHASRGFSPAAIHATSSSRAPIGVASETSRAMRTSPWRWATSANGPRPKKVAQNRRLAAWSQ